MLKKDDDNNILETNNNNDKNLCVLRFIKGTFDPKKGHKQICLLPFVLKKTVIKL